MTRGNALRDKYPDRHTYLIQRLRQPSAATIGKKRVDQVFAFGGGGSGLSDEAWELLKPCFEFDYMGAAEFEFGALPKSLAPFTDASRAKALEAFSFVLEPKDIEKRWERDSKNYRAKRKLPELPPLTEKTIYVLCRKSDKEYVQDVIRACAKNDIFLKEATMLVYTLDPINEYDGKIVGWYELNNGFFFFTAKDMWERTCELFAIKPTEEK